MPLMPKRVKFRKSQRGRVKGNATRGNTVAYGDFGLQALEGGWLSAEAIEAGRITATHSVRGEGRLYIRVFPHKSVTAIPAETRMGKGKGEPEYWAAVVKPGMVLFEIGGLPEAQAREWIELKDKGLVHRDIKPLNVILTRTGAKLLDFNIASRVGDPVRTHSGTPSYQPPDAGRDRWDVSTDLFAVGVLLYQLLCDGHHPFPNAMPMADEPVIDPRTIRADLNADLAGFLSQACAPATADRFSTAAEMLTALRGIRAGM